MASVNKVTLVGNTGRDPEVRYLQDGRAVANISIATTSRRKDRSTGETIEDTQWHRVTFYERLAEIVGEYVKKGDPIYIEGRLKYGTYVDKTTNVEKNTCDIIATELQLLGARRDGAAQGGQAPQQQRQQPQQQPQQQRQAPPQQQGYSRQGGQPPAQQRQAPPPARQSSGFDDFDDDVPF